ncbi:MAG: flagellar hook protein FlgE [Bacillota bacterium]|nr:flagellar hook protein FlgE [Bacillota bacterium]
MMRSLFSAVSGLRVHQTRMDVIGNNIANVNTPGYKSSRVTFQELFSQTLRGAGSPTGTSASERGGTNPMQVGLGVSIASIDTIHTPGNLQPTSRPTDLAIEGEGFFVVQDGETLAYTRVGNFSLDALGVLVDPEGRKVLGWTADEDGSISTSGPLGALRIPFGDWIDAQPTSRVEWIKNLDAEATVGFSKTTSVTVYDSLGRAHSIQVNFEKTGSNTWEWKALLPDGTEPSGTITFDTEGRVVDVSENQFSFTPEGADSVVITMDFTKLTQVAGPTTVEAGVTDGWPGGSLESFSFDSNGVITGFYSNGRIRVLGQIAVAGFANPSGLIKTGKNLYIQSNNSGRPEIGAAGTGGRGTIAPSSLEMSNVDLAEEFTQMIITQRGFQANSRVITVSDELLQELVNLKR